MRVNPGKKVEIDKFFDEIEDYYFKIVEQEW
jgi:hypothetical protein